MPDPVSWQGRPSTSRPRGRICGRLPDQGPGLLAFFDFPAEHWDRLRTSNPIESVFATVRHRTVRTKGPLSAMTAKLLVFNLVAAAAKTWRRLKGENQLPKVVQGVMYGRRPPCKRNLTISEAFGCGHVFGL